MAGAHESRNGPGRVFLLAYAIFAIGATARSASQILTRFEHAPLAFSLSAFAALVYVTGFVLLLNWGHPGSRRAMRWLCLLELTGVIVIGTLSLLRRDLFPETTVWSYYGMGYLFLPVVVPIAVLNWLRRTNQVAAAPRTGGR